MSKPCTDHLGNTYSTLKEICEFWGIFKILVKANENINPDVRLFQLGVMKLGYILSCTSIYSRTSVKQGIFL